MAREQTASNRYDSADDRERIEKEDEAIAKSVVSDEAVDQIGHVNLLVRLGGKVYISAL